MFDLIGDVHGCRPELLDLLRALGYDKTGKHPEGRRLVWLGDLVDRGPDTPGTLRLVMRAVNRRGALCVQGNHDWRLAAHLRGESVKVSPGLKVSMKQLAGEPRRFVARCERFLAGLPSRLELDEDRLVVVHAGERPELPEGERERYHVHGRDLGVLDEDGIERREDWMSGYAGAALVVYGHTPVLRPLWSAPNPAGGRTLNLDTGCVFGGTLSALRYPELQTVSVPAHAAYGRSKRLKAARRRERAARIEG